MTLRDYFPAGKQVGQTVSLCLDPSDPSQAGNGIRFYALLIAFCFLAAITVLLHLIAKKTEQK